MHEQTFRETDQDRLEVRVPPPDPAEPQVILTYASEEYVSPGASWKRRRFHFAWGSATPALAASGTVVAVATLVGVHAFPGQQPLVVITAIAAFPPVALVTYGAAALHRRRRSR